MSPQIPLRILKSIFFRKFSSPASCFLIVTFFHLFVYLSLSGRTAVGDPCLSVDTSEQGTSKMVRNSKRQGEVDLAGYFH